MDELTKKKKKKKKKSFIFPLKEIIPTVELTVQEDIVW